MIASLFNPDQTPFVAADRVQYLTEWSSGHGVYQTIQNLKSQAKTKRIAVATEGFFGTLPDAMLMYLHREDITNLRVEGIGQPVITIPTSFIEKAQGYQLAWLVVNSHRMKLSLPREKLLYEYCRPFNAPCLQVWDISQQVYN